MHAVKDPEGTTTPWLDRVLALIFAFFVGAVALLVLTWLGGKVYKSVFLLSHQDMIEARQKEQLKEVDEQQKKIDELWTYIEKTHKEIDVRQEQMHRRGREMNQFTDEWREAYDEWKAEHGKK